MASVHTVAPARAISPFVRLLGACCLLVALPVAAQVSFVARTDQPLEDNPAGVAAGDFNSDGALDVAVTLLGSAPSPDSIGIYLNDGTGTFTLGWQLTDPNPMLPSPESRVGRQPGDLLAVDLNADGWVDIVGTNRETPRFFAYLNNTTEAVMVGGDPWIPSDMSADGGDAFAIALADWNNPDDDELDLVLASRRRIGLAEGLGAGVFRPMSTWTNDSVGSLSDIHVADFITAEPVLDVLTVDRSDNQLVIWPGSTMFPGTVDDVNLVLVPTQVGGEDVTPFAAVIGDWNGGGQDALVATEEGYILWYANDGTPAVFSAPPVVTDIVAPLGSDPARRMPTAFTDMVYVDVDGGGVFDLVLVDAGDNSQQQGFNWLTVVFGCEDSPMPVFDIDGSVCGQPPRAHAAGSLATALPFGLVVDEFTGDGFVDAVVMNGEGSSLTLFENDGLGGFAAARSFSVGGQRARGLEANDLDGDTITDVAVALFSESTVGTLTGTGNGGFLPPERLEAPALTNPSRAHAASINDGQDATVDVLAEFGSDHVLWKGAGGGGFGVPAEIGQADGRARLADVVGSPSLDIVTVNRLTNRVQIWEGDGTGGFAIAQDFGGVPQYQDHVIAPFFRSSRPDIVIAGAESGSGTAAKGFWLLRHDRDMDNYQAPEFLAYVDIDSNFNFLDLQTLTTSDLDESGDWDIVGLTATGSAFVLPSTGATFSIELASYDTGSPVIGAQLADVTGDDVVDLVTALAKEVSVIPGSGGFVFDVAQKVRLLTNFDNDSLDIADVNGDDRLDILVASEFTNDVTVLINVGTPKLKITVEKGATCDISWPDQGVNARFDVVRGNIWDLLTMRGMDDVTCLVDDLDANLHSADCPTSLPTDGCYFIVRCQDGGTGECSALGWGTTSADVARAPSMACPP